MSIPWRAAEAMHWQMGEQEMERRVNNLITTSPEYADDGEDGAGVVVDARDEDDRESGGDTEPISDMDGIAADICSRNAEEVKIDNQA